ncbi:malto-oligosyltrehalose synthase [Omnitrophica bacterium]|nr:malto-oligosyltrehalose synthase [Candidatus Omnitrophota bacterium]
MNRKACRELIREFLRNRPVFPSSTYRLQLHKDFGFSVAAGILDYLKELGLGAIYASPFLTASKGSTHGYDVTDPAALNPELGGPADFEKFCEALHGRGLKQIMDVVANHMGIGQGENKYWQDVLENGPSSVYARYFDIDWDPKNRHLRNKVLIPVLGDHYGKVLENQEIVLSYAEGEFKIQYWQHALPVAPKTYPLILEQGLDELKKQFEPNDAKFGEFLSIVTAFKNLPARTETGPEKISLRNREKEIAKSRLHKLVTSEGNIRQYVQSRVQVFNGTPGEPESFNLLDGLLNQQAYRVAYWRVAAEEINYRRFFDINELAAVRTEDEETFRFYHELIFKLLAAGKVHGLRIDHPDGLYDPPAYYRRLQKQYLMQSLSDQKTVETRELARLLDNEEFASAAPLYVVVEKILDRKEPLPEDWQVHGTVGYDFLNTLNGLFIERQAEKEMDAIYEEFTGRKIDFDEVTYEKKKFFALVNLASEISHLAHRLSKVSEKSRYTRDFTLNNLTVALREVIACFPVYRTYLSPRGESVCERDGKYIRIAIEKAKRKTPALAADVYDFLADVLTLQFKGRGGAEEREYRDFILRFQQLTGPVMAKGMEDTAFYIYNRLISLNEVGADPTHFGVSPADFHKNNQDRANDWPGTLLAASTHDTKRSEDVRMRIHVLTELAGEWRTELVKWVTTNEKYKTEVGGQPAPDRNTEYFIYQTLLGVWPNERLEDEAYEDLTGRISQAVHKSIREAKTKTSWLSPQPEYEEAVAKFVAQILKRGEENHFLRLFAPFQKKIAECGFFNSLSACVLRAGSPGVMDIYQGDEIWNYALVDPDNRRPVDYPKRKALLSQMRSLCAQPGQRLEAVQAFLKQRADGRIKLFVICGALHARAKFQPLFTGGDYLPVQVEGEKKNYVVAFLRRKGDRFALVLGARYFSSMLNGDGQVDLSPSFWQDTRLLLPREWAAQALTDIFTGRQIKADKETLTETASLPVSAVLGPMGAALLINEEVSFYV